MAKVLVEIYKCYGKDDARALSSEFIIEDSTEKRKRIVERELGDDLCSDTEYFINGETNNLYIDIEDDWDSPTAIEFIITTEEEHLLRTQKEIENALNRHNKFFNK